jgi:hypothetical protein
MRVNLVCAIELPSLKVNLKSLECLKKILFGLFKAERDIEKVSNLLRSN